MARNRVGMSFKGFEEMAAKFDSMGGDLRSVVTECLEKTNAHITPKLHADMQKHNRSGKTESSISDSSHVEWEGANAYIKVGFNIKEGGLPSIFLMYGTPRMKKDTRLYNDIYGKKTRDEVRVIQEQIFRRKFDEIMGGG